MRNELAICQQDGGRHFSHWVLLETAPAWNGLSESGARRNSSQVKFDINTVGLQASESVPLLQMTTNAFYCCRECVVPDNAAVASNFLLGQHTSCVSPRWRTVVCWNYGWCVWWLRRGKSGAGCCVLRSSGLRFARSFISVAVAGFSPVSFCSSALV